VRVEGAAGALGSHPQTHADLIDINGAQKHISSDGEMEAMAARDAALSYREQARRFAPKTLEEIEVAARNLARHGYGDHTIASALEVSVIEVRRILGSGQERQCG
jgi:ribosomal protein S11